MRTLSSPIIIIWFLLLPVGAGAEGPCIKDGSRTICKPAPNVLEFHEDSIQTLHGSVGVDPLRIDANGKLRIVDDCPRRMREAMKLMDLWRKRSPDVSKYMDAYMRDLHDEVEQQWEQTMKACVEGK